MADFIKVRIGTREHTLDEVREAMDPARREKIEAQYTNHATPEGAQAFVEAYGLEHTRATGELFTVKPGGGHGGDPGNQGQGQGQETAPGQNKPTPR